MNLETTISKTQNIQYPFIFASFAFGILLYMLYCWKSIPFI